MSSADTAGSNQCNGIADTLVRLSVGIENKADLKEDLVQALSGGTAARGGLPKGSPVYL